MNADHEANGSLPASALRGLLHDFTHALGQQMFFWGRDVIHPDGNLLKARGFDRRPSEGLDGTSCYRLDYEGDVIELHGACVGRYSETTDGFLFIRNRKRCFLYFQGEPPAPGIYAEEHLRPGPAADLFTASRRFLDWWLEYEDWIAEVAGPGYRAACYRAFRKLPRSRPWLPPELALTWLRAYANEEPASLRRARDWKRDQETNSPS